MHKFLEVQKQHQLLWNSLILNADGKLCFLKNKFNRIRHRLLHHNKIWSVNVKDEHLYKNPTASHDLQRGNVDCMEKFHDQASLRMNMHL